MSWDDFDSAPVGVGQDDLSGLSSGFLSTSLNPESAIFRPTKVDLRLSRDRTIKQLVAANNVLVIALDQPRVVRVNRDRNEVDDIELPRRPDDQINK
jgi:hypothetical protein